MAKGKKIKNPWKEHMLREKYVRPHFRNVKGKLVQVKGHQHKYPMAPEEMKGIRQRGIKEFDKGREKGNMEKRKEAKERLSCVMS